MYESETYAEEIPKSSLSLTYSQQELIENLDPIKVLEVLDFAKQMESTARVLSE